MVNKPNTQFFFFGTKKNIIKKCKAQLSTQGNMMH